LNGTGVGRSRQGGIGWLEDQVEAGVIDRHTLIGLVAMLGFVRFEGNDGIQKDRGFIGYPGCVSKNVVGWKVPKRDPTHQFELLDSRLFIILFGDDDRFDHVPV